MKTSEIIDLITNALDLEPNSLTIDSSSEDIEEWDSLGHITILSALDDMTSGKSADLADLTQASSVKEIIDILKENSLIHE